MRVALDFRMADHTGIGRYLRELLPHLPAADPELEILLLVPDGVAAPSPLPPGIERLRWEDAPEVYSLEEQWAFEPLRQRYPFDLLHVPHFHAPVLAGPPMVATVHDLVFLHFPEECPSTAAHLYARLMYRAVAARARRLVTVSETVRQDVIESLGVSPTKVIAAPHGAPSLGPPPGPEEVARVASKLGIGDRYLLSVGMQRPRKNLVRLVRAYQATGLANEGVKLVLAGPADPRGAAVAQEIRRAGLGEHVIQTDFVEPDDLPGLYAGALALAAPSLYEGFGFPPVEAFAYGVPVAAARASALPETCQDAAEYFPPEDEAAMARALTRVTQDPARRQELSAAGHRRRQQLRWEETARRTARAYREALDD